MNLDKNDLVIPSLIVPPANEQHHPFERDLLTSIYWYAPVFKYAGNLHTKSLLKDNLPEFKRLRLKP